MSCNNPNVGQIEMRINKFSGEVERKLHFLGSARKRFEHSDRRILWEQTEEGERVLAENGNEFLLLPCGKCLGCRVDRARRWGARAYLESIGKTGNFFVTLTVSDEVQKWIGEDVRRDLITTFMKRLRKRFGDGIRFFACGEYGSKTHRAHYHVLLYNCPFSVDDMVQFGSNFRGERWYLSEDIESCWWFKIPEWDEKKKKIVYCKTKIGFVSVSPLTVDTCAYTARYCSKKQDDVFLDELEKDGRHLPFLQMSRRPGIASDWIDEHLEEVFDPEGDGKVALGKGFRIAPPKYFRDRADRRGIDRSTLIDRQRRAVRNELNNMLQNHDYDEAEFWTIRELKLAEKNLKWIRQIE